MVPATNYICQLPQVGNPGQQCGTAFAEPYPLQRHRQMCYNVWQPTDRAYAKRRSADREDIANMKKAILLQILPGENAMFNEARGRFAALYARASQHRLTQGIVFRLSPDTPARDAVTKLFSGSLSLA